MSGSSASRRQVVAGAGALTLGFALGRSAGAQPRPPGDLAKTPQIDAWLRVGVDGTVTLLTGKVELGQGVLTAFAQICADELDVDLKRIRIVSGDTALSPDEGATAGSMSMPEGGTAVRAVCAEARAILLDMAARRWRVDPGALRVEDGVVAAAGGRRRTTYWALIGDGRFARSATGAVRPKPPAEQRWIGRPTPRLDLPAKFTGEPTFVQDLRLPGMVHARVVRPPAAGARLETVDASAVERLPDVLKIVRDGAFLAVIAEREWAAVKAAEALRARARWSGGAGAPGDPYAWLLAQPAEVKVIERRVRPHGRAVAHTLEAQYRRAFQMHGSIGPSCAVAELREGRLTVFTHSQTVFDTRTAIAKLVGLAPAQVRLRHMQGAGCYGHNGADDAAADAALLACAFPGRPVRVQWSRDDEHAFEPYGPAMVTRVRAETDGEGRVLDWTYDLWSTSHGSRPSGDPGNLLAGTEIARAFATTPARNGGPPSYAADRNAIPGYDFPGRAITTHFIPAGPVRTSSHRSLGAYANVFSIESFMDELAHAAAADPLDYRLAQLSDPRGRAVLQRAADRFGWKAFTRLSGRGRGLAYARYKNLASWCAVCVEAEVDAITGEVRVLRAVLAADAGEIVNPDGLKNQLEGGLIQSLSWTLLEQVRWDGSRVESRDWETYPILTFSQVPEIEIELIDRPGQPYLGAGEAAQGPTAAAVANAVFDASGRRPRSLPILSWLGY